MRTMNINKLYIGKNSDNDYRLGMLIKDDSILREIVVNEDTISLGMNNLMLNPSLQLSSILFSDFDKEEQQKTSIFSNFEVSESLISDWAHLIKTDTKINQCLTRLSDSNLEGWRENLENFLKKELLHSLFFDYIKTLEYSKTLNNEPSLEK